MFVCCGETLNRYSPEATARFDQGQMTAVNHPHIHPAAWHYYGALHVRLKNLSEIMENPEVYL
jgi:hypothetical protein